MSWKQHKLICKSRKFLDVIILSVLVLVYVFSPELTLKVVLGLLFFFLPGYSITRFVFRNGKNDFPSTITYTIMVSLCVIPLVGNLVEIFAFLSSYTILLAILVFSLPFLLFCDTNPIGKKEEKQEIEDVFYKGMAFFGSIAVGFGLYLQASLGSVAPRGWDIYRHMYVVNNMISTGTSFFHPGLNVLSNFHRFLLAELSLLTGLDVLTAALLGQAMLGAVYAISMFYFTRYVTGSLTASFVSVVLFFVGPPILNVDLILSMTDYYFYFFHPMWVALSIFPFALAYVHENLVNNKNKSVSLAPIFIVALFFYHLTVGLLFTGIILFDFLLLLLKFRKKFLVLNLAKTVVLTFCLSSVLTIPFLFNITNPFKYIYPQGGLQTLYTMFFGVSGYQLTSPLMGSNFFAQVFLSFAKEILPIIIIGVPGLVYLSLKRSTSFILILSCILAGLIGLAQPLFGLAFMAERFIEPLIIFGATLAGASLSLLMALPYIRFRRHGKSIKIRVDISKRGSSGFTLLFLTFSFMFLYSYSIFYSPAKDAVLLAPLHIHEDDAIAIRWIDENIPRNSKILTDQYLQVIFTGITGRKPIFTIFSQKRFFQLWDIYPVNVYDGQVDPLEVNVDYFVISPWSFTKGKEYFDQHENLTQIYEHSFIKGDTNATYAVYEVIR